MSIQSEIVRIENNIAEAYDAAQEMGAALPEEQNSGNLAETIRSIKIFPSGGIIIWSGAADAVPDGWALCDGENGTPDLRGRFVLGSSDNHAKDETGGEETHTLTDLEMPRHNHYEKLNLGSNSDQLYIRPIQGGTKVGYSIHPSTINYSSNLYALNPVCTSLEGYGFAHNNMPPYYVLCYIMKL